VEGRRRTSSSISQITSALMPLMEDLSLGHSHDTPRDTRRRPQAWSDALSPYTDWECALGNDTHEHGSTQRFRVHNAGNDLALTSTLAHSAGSWRY